MTSDFFDSTMKTLGHMGEMGMQMFSNLFGGGHEHAHSDDAQFHAHVDPNTHELTFTDAYGNDITDKVIFVDQEQQQQEEQQYAEDHNEQYGYRR